PLHVPIEKADGIPKDHWRQSHFPRCRRCSTELELALDRWPKMPFRHRALSLIRSAAAGVASPFRPPQSKSDHVTAAAFPPQHQEQDAPRIPQIGAARREIDCRLPCLRPNSAVSDLPQPYPRRRPTT
ncbi:hypothetical protein E2562_038419, partial [Oryza meyeriana var. granulata]